MRGFDLIQVVLVFINRQGNVTITLYMREKRIIIDEGNDKNGRILMHLFLVMQCILAEILVVTSTRSRVSTTIL